VGLHKAAFEYFALGPLSFPLAPPIELRPPTMDSLVAAVFLPDCLLISFALEAASCSSYTIAKNKRLSKKFHTLPGSKQVGNACGASTTLAIPSAVRHPCGGPGASPPPLHTAAAHNGDTHQAAVAY
jgi:hypothetical protein